MAEPGIPAPSLDDLYGPEKAPSPGDLYGPEKAPSLDDLYGPEAGKPRATPPPRHTEKLSVDHLISGLREPIAEGYRFWDPKIYREALRSARQIPDRTQRTQERDRIKRARTKAKLFDRSARKLEIEARRRGDHETVERIREARRQARSGESDPVEALKAGGAVLMDALDALHKYAVRSWTTPEREGDDPNEIVDSREWTKRIREDAKKGKAVPSAVIGAADLVSLIPGNILGSLVASAGAITDVVTGQPVSMENIKQTIRETQEDVADFMLIMATDPLSWVSFTTAGTVKNAMTTTARAMKPMVAANRLAEPIAKALVDDVGRIAAKHAGTKDAFPKIIEAFEGVGLKADDAKNLFGHKGEFFGKDQLTLHAPFLSKYGVQPIAAVTGQEYAAGKALQKGYGKTLKPLIEKVSGSKVKELFDPEAGFLKDLRRKGKGHARIAEQKLLHEYEDISALAPAKSRRKWIVRNIIDPAKPASDEALRSLDATEREWVAKLDKFFEKVHDMGVDSGYFKPGQIARNKHTGKYFPRQYQREWGWFDDLPEARKAFLNKISPVISRTDEGGLPLGALVAPEDVALAEKKLAAVMEANKQNPSKEVAKMLEDAKQEVEALREGLGAQTVAGEFDPHRAVPQYVQRAARGMGAAQLETDVLKAFGVAPTEFAKKTHYLETIGQLNRYKLGVTKRLKGADGNADVIDAAKKQLEGLDIELARVKDLRSKWEASGLKERDIHETFGSHRILEGTAISNEVGNFLHGSFDDSLTTFRNWTAKLPGAQSPLGRAANRSMEAYAHVTNFWKRNVLVTRPGYHVINSWNDTLQMVADGNINAGKWVRWSDKGLRGKGGKDIEVRIGDDVIRYSLDEVIKIAREHNLPIDTADVVSGQVVRLEEIGPAAAKYYRFQDASLRGVKGRLKKEGKKLSDMADVAQKAEFQKEALASGFKKAVKDWAGGAPLAAGIPSLPAKHGELMAQAWEARAKLAHFAWRLSKGDSPAIAAQRALDVLLDYTDPGRTVQIMRWVMPFATWTFKAPQMTARLAAKRPSAIVGTKRFFESQEDPEDKKLAPRSYVSQRAPYYHLGQRGRQTLENLRYMGRRLGSPFSGETAEESRAGVSTEGLGAVYMPREPFGESLTFPMEVSGLSSLVQEGELKPQLDPAIAALSPTMKGLGEFVFERDVLTGRPLERPSPMAMFPARAPGFVPEALRAQEEEAPYLSRYIIPKFLSPGQIAALNMYGYRAGGGEEGRAPLATIGSYRPYAPPGQAENIQAQQYLNMALGMPAYTVGPGDQPYELGQRLEKIREKVWKATREAKEARKAARRKR